MFKKRSSKNKAFVILHQVKDTSYHEDTIFDSQAVPNTSFHPLKPTITLPLLDDKDFVLSRHKNLKKKIAKTCVSSSPLSQSLPEHKSPTPSSHQPVTPQTTLLQDTNQQTLTFPSCDLSNKLKENVLPSFLNQPTLSASIIDPHSHCYYLLNSIDRLQKNKMMDACHFCLSTNSDEDTWEYEQLARTNNLPRSMSNPSEESYQRKGSFNLQDNPQRRGTGSANSLKNNDTLFATFDRVNHSLDALNDKLTSYQCQLNTAQKKYEQALQDQHAASYYLCDVQVCEADSQEFHDFQKCLLWLQNLSECILDKSDAVRLAYETLEKLEKEEFQFLNEEDAKLNSSLLSFNLPCKSSTLTLETAQNNMIDNPANNSASPSACGLNNTKHTNGLSERLLQSLIHKRKKFSKGVLDIFQNVNEDFINLDKITIIYLDMLQKYPFLLHETCFIPALQTIVTFVMRYKLLLWNPILPLNHSSTVEQDNNESFFLIPSYNSLRSMASQLKVMILEHECPTCLNKGLSPLVNQNFVEYVIFEILLCRVSRWVSQCWNPLSISQSKKICPILCHIITNDTKKYAETVVTLKSLIFEKFQEAAMSYCVLQDSEIHSFDNHIACLIKAKLLCDIIISFYDKILSEDHFRCLIINTVYDNYKRLRTPDISTIPYLVKSHFVMLTQGLPSFLLSSLDEETKDFIKQLLQN